MCDVTIGYNGLCWACQAFLVIWSIWFLGVQGTISFFVERKIQNMAISYFEIFK